MLAGVVLRLVAIFLLTSLSAAIHQLGKSHVPTGQLMFWRAVVSMVPILIYLALRRELGTLRTRHPGKHIVRGLVGATAMSLNFMSLAWLPVATAQSLGFLGPVLSLPLAALILREKITRGVLLSVLLGFAGAMMVLAHAIEAPREGQVTGVLCGLAFAVCIAFNRIQIKHMTVTESAGAIAFTFTLAAAGLGLILSPPWTWAGELTSELFPLMLLAGLCGGLGHIAMTEATARAPVSALAAFEFTALIWAAGFDLLFFDNRPGALEVAGIVTILLATALPLLRITGRTR